MDRGGAYASERGRKSVEEALKEIWEIRFKKAREAEFVITEKDFKREAELLKLKIDLCLDAGNVEKFEKFSKQLKSIESFLSLKNS